MGRSFLADIPGNFFTHRLGTSAPVASNGAGAILEDIGFVCPADLKVLSVWRANISASDVTKGTATTSASYRRNTLVNGSTDGSGTVIMASLNATSSKASLGTRAFATTANNTAPAGNILLMSHLTVGAETSAGTDMAACIFEFSYELL